MIDIKRCKTRTLINKKQSIVVDGRTVLCHITKLCFFNKCCTNWPRLTAEYPQTPQQCGLTLRCRKVCLRILA